MPKRGWLIAFNQEVASPGESVAHNRPRQSINRVPQHECSYNNCQSQKSPQSMHDTVTPVAVLRQVKGEKFLIIGKCLL